jgi:hypothetical protein
MHYFHCVHLSKQINQIDLKFKTNLIVDFLIIILLIFNKHIKYLNFNYQYR